MHGQRHKKRTGDLRDEKNNRSRFSATTFVTYYVFDNCLLAVRMHCILSASFHRFMIRAEKKVRMKKVLGGDANTARWRSGAKNFTPPQTPFPRRGAAKL